MSYTLHPRWSSLQELIDAKGDDEGALQLDLGCGYVKPEGFIGLDDLTGAAAQHPSEELAPDVFLDLNQAPLPFEEDSCKEVRASHFLEHSNLNHIFEQVFRVLRPGGTFLFVVPYANSAEGMFPGHQIFLTERFFYENLHFQHLFHIDREQYTPSEIWEAMPKELKKMLPFDQARQVLFNVCNQMMIWASPRKQPVA